MRNITVSRITNDVNQNILIQLMGYIGPIESFIYSDDNTQLQISYNDNVDIQKAMCYNAFGLNFCAFLEVPYACYRG